MLRTCLVRNTNVFISVLRIAHHTTVAYVIRLVLVFALSGAVHVGLDLGFALSIAETGAMKFFILQAVGMLLEQAMWSALQFVGCGGGFGKAGRLIGYLWVCAFLALTAPMWVVPIIKSLYEGGERVPASLLLGGKWLFA